MVVEPSGNAGSFHSLQHFERAAIEADSLFDGDDRIVSIRTFLGGLPVESFVVGIEGGVVSRLRHLKVNSASVRGHGKIKPFSYGEVGDPGYYAGVNDLLRYFCTRDEKVIAWIPSKVFEAESSSVIERDGWDR